MQAKSINIGNYSKTRKIMLVLGVLIGLVGLLVIFPFEKAKTSFVMELVGTFGSLSLAILLVLYGFTGTRFFKYISYTLLSILASMLSWYVYFSDSWWQKIIMVWIGIPTGVIAALVFFVLRYFIFVRNQVFPIAQEKRRLLVFNQVLLYALVLGVVSVLVYKFGK